MLNTKYDPGKEKTFKKMTRSKFKYTKMRPLSHLQIHILKLIIILCHEMYHLKCTVTYLLNSSDCIHYSLRGCLSQNNGGKKAVFLFTGCRAKYQIASGSCTERVPHWFIAHFLDKGENKLNIFKITQRYQHFQGSEKIQLLSAKN